MKALIKRAEVIGAISRLDAVRLYKQYSARRWNNAEPNTITMESPTLVREAARVHLHDHGYSLRELADAVLLNEDELWSELLDGSERNSRALSLVRD